MSSTPPTPTEVPNVVIRNPKVRTVVYDVFGIVGLALFAVVVADAAAPEFDLTAFTSPALAVFSVVGAGIGYTARQNTPLS